MPDDTPFPKHLYAIGAVIIFLLAIVIAWQVGVSNKPHPVPTTATIGPEK
jgi:hypothetical protein